MRTIPFVKPAGKYNAAQSNEPNVLEAPGGLGGADLLLLSIHSCGPLGLWRE